MVYMVIDRDRKAVKIGFTENLERRMREYRTHNPFADFVDVLSGDEELECELQERMIDMGFTSIKGTEWMRIPKGISRKYVSKMGFKIFC